MRTEDILKALTGLRCYCVNRSMRQGKHQVHDLSNDNPHCLPSGDNRHYLGPHLDCHSAIKKAEEYYDNVDGCDHCCPKCHNK